MGERKLKTTIPTKPANTSQICAASADSENATLAPHLSHGT